MNDIAFCDVAYKFHYADYPVLSGATFRLDEAVNTLCADKQSGKSKQKDDKNEKQSKSHLPCKSSCHLFSTPAAISSVVIHISIVISHSLHLYHSDGIEPCCLT